MVHDLCQGQPLALIADKTQSVQIVVAGRNDRFGLLDVEQVGLPEVHTEDSDETPTEQLNQVVTLRNVNLYDKISTIRQK